VPAAGQPQSLSLMKSAVRAVPIPPDRHHQAKVIVAWQVRGAIPLRDRSDHAVRGREFNAGRDPDSISSRVSANAVAARRLGRYGVRESCSAPNMCGPRSIPRSPHVPCSRCDGASAGWRSRPRAGRLAHAHGLRRRARRGDW
jgi:hypothetical protein